MGLIPVPTYGSTQAFIGNRELQWLRFDLRSKTLPYGTGMAVVWCKYAMLKLSTFFDQNNVLCL